jgi:hypothetical protein
MKPCPIRYEIRLAERLEAHWSQIFPDLQIHLQGGNAGPGTLLSGSLPDQAALFGVLGRIRDLNLTLLEVRRIENGEP